MASANTMYFALGLFASVAVSHAHVDTTRKAETVFMTMSDCGSVMDIGQPSNNWKRLMFKPGETCSKQLNCKITLKKNSVSPFDSNICVDFSRLLLHGDGIWVTITDEESPGHQVLLSKNRVPMKEKYMNTVFCINADHRLVIQFEARCDYTLDKAFDGWMYGYVESSASGSIYFVDDGAAHRHRMSSDSQATVSVRSHIWRDSNSPIISRLRLGIGSDAERTKLCISWNPLVNVRVPRGVEVKIYRAYFNMERADLSLFYLREGDDINSHRPSSACYWLTNIKELVFEVHNRAGRNLGSDWKEEELLFELAVAAGGYVEDFLFPPWPVDKSKRTPEEGVTTEISTTSTSTSSGVPFKALVYGGSSVAVALLIICLCCLICRNRSGSSSNNGNNAGTAGTAEGEAIQPSNVETGAESHPMMPRAQPSAPQWEGSDRWREGQAGQGYPPYPYSAGPDGGVNKEAASQDPPSYSELFPSHPTHKC